MRGLNIAIVLILLFFCYAPTVLGSEPVHFEPSAPAETAMQPASTTLALQAAPSADAKPAPVSTPFSHSLSLTYSDVSGTSSVTTRFNSGRSRLDWPMDFGLVGGTYRARYREIAEWGISLQACPWTRSAQPMKDIDMFDESRFNGGIPVHDGIDIYSESTTDVKAFLVDLDLRVFALSSRYASMGLLLAYQAQEMDYKTYDTQQVGYGPWDDNTFNLLGPTSTYTVNYDIYTVGLTWRLKAGSRASLTVDTAFIPRATTTDEDNHLRRLRSSEIDCKGNGTRLSLNAKLALNRNWFVSSSCSRIRISGDGTQKQHWYGDDPGTMINDTGRTISGIDAEIKQDSFHIGLSLGRTL